MRTEEPESKSSNKEIRKGYVTPKGSDVRSPERVSSFPEALGDILPGVMDDILSRIDHAKEIH